jgi:ribosomal protein S18 acetylase RimI-like enzyme
MNIRPATADDVAAVLPMVAKLAALHESWDQERYGYLPDVADIYRGWLTTRARDPKSVFLVAEVEQKVVGFLIGTVERAIPIYRLSEYGFLHDVWVEEPYRHEGIARQMTMLAIERFRALGMTQVRLETAALNDIARDLFVSCGFRISAVEMMYEIKGTADARG